MTKQLDPDELFLTASEVAARYRVAESTLANQRTQASGLPYVKIGGRVLYRASDLADAEAAGARGLAPEVVLRSVTRVFGITDRAKLDTLWRVIREEALRD